MHNLEHRLTEFVLLIPPKSVYTNFHIELSAYVPFCPYVCLSTFYHKPQYQETNTGFHFKMYCLVLVGSRNGFERDSTIKQNKVLRALWKIDSNKPPC